jgi:hypothetical protein
MKTVFASCTLGFILPSIAGSSNMCRMVLFVSARSGRAKSAPTVICSSTFARGGRKAATFVVFLLLVGMGEYRAGGLKGSAEETWRSSLVLTVWWAVEARWAWNMSAGNWSLWARGLGQERTICVRTSTSVLLVRISEGKSQTPAGPFASDTHIWISESAATSASEL